MNKHLLEARTRAFAVSVIGFSQAVPRSREADVLIRQLLRSATSIGSNYREANRAESRKDFIHKIGIVEKEASETLYWLQLLNDSKLATGSALQALMREADELLAIFTAIGRSTKSRPGSMQIRDGTMSDLTEISDFGSRISDLSDPASRVKRKTVAPGARSTRSNPKSPRAKRPKSK